MEPVNQPQTEEEKREYFRNLGKKSAEARKAYPKSYYADLGRRSAALKKARKEAKKKTPIKILGHFLSKGEV